MSDYHKDQLNRLKDSEWAKTVKLSDNTGNQTNTLDLNVDSIPVLIQWLKKELKKVSK